MVMRQDHTTLSGTAIALNDGVANQAMKAMTQKVGHAMAPLPNPLNARRKIYLHESQIMKDGEYDRLQTGEASGNVTGR